MRFVTNPQLILTKDEFETLDNALKLCRDMDEWTNRPTPTCSMCPFKDNCPMTGEDCVYEVAHRALKQIIDIAIVK